MRLVSSEDTLGLHLLGAFPDVPDAFDALIQRTLDPSRMTSLAVHGAVIMYAYNLVDPELDNGIADRKEWAKDIIVTAPRARNEYEDWIVGATGIARPPLLWHAGFMSRAIMQGINPVTDFSAGHVMELHRQFALEDRRYLQKIWKKGSLAYEDDQTRHLAVKVGKLSTGMINRHLSVAQEGQDGLLLA